MYLVTACFDGKAPAFSNSAYFWLLRHKHGYVLMEKRDIFPCQRSQRQPFLPATSAY